MSFVESGSEILAARDRRQERITAALETGASSVLALSLNIPGPEKSPPGTEALFAQGMEHLGRTFPLRIAFQETDRLGPFAVLLCGAPARRAKEVGVALETAFPAARLLDLDVYGSRGDPVGRREVGLPPRPCLLCEETAADCMRLARHDYSLLRARIDELLRPFRP